MQSTTKARTPQYRRSAGLAVYARGRVVGTVVGDVFRKRIYASRHLLRRPRAIAFDVQSLVDAQCAGARLVEVTDVESGATYSASLAEVLRCGFTFDRGHGRQIALPLDLWRRRAPGDVAAVQLVLEMTW